MKKIIGMFLPIVSFPVFSRIWGLIVRIKYPRFIVKRVIRLYRKIYNIDMNDYQGQCDDYRNLSDFFIRKLDPKTRPLIQNEDCIVSPADGVLTVVETVYEDKALQIKGRYYSVSKLIKDDLDFSKGMHVATIYLSPSNYHRYHYPVSGTVQRYFHTGGRLFPVNNAGLTHVDKLFTRNERVIVDISLRMKTGNSTNCSPCYFVAVGATFVGSIKMEFINKQAHKKKKWIKLEKDVDQLAEMGRFDIGSTIVMVIPKEIADPIEEMICKSVRVGDPIFKLSR